MRSVAYPQHDPQAKEVHAVCSKGMWRAGERRADVWGGDSIGCGQGGLRREKSGGRKRGGSIDGSPLPSSIVNEFASEPVPTSQML